jgi:hypothetical protein
MIQSYTCTQIIQDALYDLGVLRIGQLANADLLAAGQRAGNQMLDAMLLNRLLVFAIRPDIYTLTAAQTYTIGPAGADLTNPRPTQIEDANVLINTISPVIRKPLRIGNTAEWASYAVRVMLNLIPTFLYYDKNFDVTNGWGSLNLWPGPVAGYQLELFTWQQLQEFEDLTTSYKFPPGYARLMRKNLALEVAPMVKGYAKIDQPLLDLIARQARDAMGEVESYNAPEQLQQCDEMFLGSSSSGGTFNWQTGESGR